ncbi:MAG: IS481 family transposase [Armatimonadetes bacterium]|nr:IS481 family transposase [Armatimonadota bacterium]
MSKEAREYCRFHQKLAAIEYAEEWGNVRKACRTFCVSRSAFYRWKKLYDEHGEAGLRQRKPLARDHPRRIPDSTIEKVIELRTKYHLGPQRIVWYMDRYHGIRISFSSVYRILVRNGLRRLPSKAGRRALHTRRYSKQVPGHHIQMDVKFVNLVTEQGSRVRRYQYTAIDDATRIRALRIYRRHTQANAIRFVDYVIKKFPFRIHTIRTDRGHEWQAKFHWHVEDQGIRHVYIKPRSPQLNGKVERSHRTDQDEFYQLLTYTDDVDLSSKLASWEEFYNLHRPHGAHEGKTPYEVLRSKIEAPPGVLVD